MNDEIYRLRGKSLSGPRVLVGREFFKEKLETIEFGSGRPLEGSPVSVYDCRFISCATKGEFSISHGVEMRSVTFDEMRSPDHMMVSSASIFESVVIRGGRKASSLWCTPPHPGDVSAEIIEWARVGVSEVDLAIDFSELAAPEIEVLGIPSAKLKWNPELHICVSTTWETSEHWAALDLAPESIWRLTVERLHDFGCDEGVFSLPVPGDDNYLTDMEELARIESAGLVQR